MKVLFIVPGVGKIEKKKYIKSWKMEPLMMAYLKALTPDHVTTFFFDDRVELIDYSLDADLVAITIETYTAKRGYAIAKKFLQRNIPVIFGGYHATLCTDEALEHGSAVLKGEAEGIWDKILTDAAVGKLKKIYKNNGSPFLRINPDRSIYQTKKETGVYTPLTLIETSRGCPFSCEFYAVSQFFNKKYKTRPMRDVISEIKETGQKYFFFIDDNFTGNIEYTKKLLKELIPLNIKWASQGTLTLARDPELLDLLHKSGCIMLLIGIESLVPKNLQQMKKQWILDLGELDQLIDKIHRKGISIYATFVFGYDNDDTSTFKNAIDFSLKHNFFFAAFNHLLPWPGTALYCRLKDENRFAINSWWLDKEYKYGDYAFIPKNMTREELKENCTNARKRFFSLPNILKRGIKLLQRTQDPLLHYIFYSQNLLLQKEIEQKLTIPIGKGLDSLPK